jgi:predicted unusual protein kinase regulating ubiquinone biosynthesis (AarF/ABC1/UbiB family)
VPDRSPTRLDRRRYLRVVWFLTRLFAHLSWWDVVLRRLWPSLAERTADARWRGLARRYRALAVTQGGLLIKLGQFLSIRVDVLPRAIIAELAGLQDAVPPEPFTAVRAVIETAFGQSLGAVFATVDPEPLGAASLAQVHRAALPDGRRVVVKVQRPRIGTLVETDLAAFRFGVRLLKRLGWVRRRADMERLYDEFARTTRAELDFVAEGHNAETFARNYAGDPLVQIPAVFWTHTRERVLTLEEVVGIKVSDLDALAAAGVDPRAVARRLADAYFQQIFVHNFVHSDPHPGNLFVVPVPAPDAGASESTAFQLAFVDFGMVAVVPERVRAHLRDYLIGFATRDPARCVRAYAGAGVLLPGADLRRIEQAQAAVFDRFWGARMGDLQQLAMTEARALVGEFSDLLREMPFQLPADLLFIGRAFGILSGLATQLDPEFDVWAAMAPYARQLTAGDGKQAARAWHRPELPLEAQLRALETQVRALIGAATLLEVPARSLLTLPGGLERALTQATTGQLVVRVDLGDDLRADVNRLRGLVRTLIWAVAFGALALAGAIIRGAEGPSLLSTLMLGGAGVALVVVLLRR